MSLPDPLVPADTDISGFDCFMMNVQQLLSSELWAVSTGDEFKAAMALWCRAWTQTPPGSLPKDEKVLAAFSGAGAKWRKVRAVAMRGFVECSDGRLYHKTLCEDVLRAAQRKKERRERTARATEARRKKPPSDDPPTSPLRDRNDDRNDSATSDVTRSHRRDGTGRDSISNNLPQQPYDRAAAAASLDDLKKACVLATGWAKTSGISAIADLVASGVDLDGRVLPMLRTIARQRRDRRQAPPELWSFAVPIIRDETREPDAQGVVVDQVFVKPDSDDWRALVASGRKESLLREIAEKRGGLWLARAEVERALKGFDAEDAA